MITKLDDGGDDDDDGMAVAILMMMMMMMIYIDVCGTLIAASRIDPQIKKVHQK